MTQADGDLVTALRQCRSVLAMLTEPESIRATTVHHAWAQAVAAEQQARKALTDHSRTAAASLKDPL